MAKDAYTPSRGASLITIQSSIIDDLKTHPVLFPNTKVIMFTTCSNEAEKSHKETQTHLSFGPHQLLWQEGAALSGPSEAASSLQSQEESSLSFNLSAEPCTQQTAKADCILFSLKHTNTHSRNTTPPGLHMFVFPSQKLATSPPPCLHVFKGRSSPPESSLSYASHAVNTPLQ